MRSQAGLTLVELMVAMLIGLLLLGGLFTVHMSNQRSARLNEAVASMQEDARFILAMLAEEIRQAGMYNMYTPELTEPLPDITPDLTREADFIAANPLLLPGNFQPPFHNLGGQDGGVDGPDILVTGSLGSRDCRALRHGYPASPASGQPVPFPVINAFFLGQGQLRCLGFDARVLQGDKAAVENNTEVILLDNVADFQVLYGIARPEADGRYLGHPAYYKSADQLPAEMASGGQVVTMRLALVLRSAEPLGIAAHRSIKALNQAARVPDDGRLYQTFETTVLLRNNWNRITMRMAMQ